MKPILVATLVSMAPVADACPPDLKWDGLRGATTTYHNDAKSESGTVAIMSYSDGVYARTGQKEIYFLRDHDLVVFRGLPVEELKTPSPFFMIDMAAAIPVLLLAGHFATPCAVPEREDRFDFTPSSDLLHSGKDPKPVTGRASRQGVMVTYEVRTDGRPRGALIHASGTFDLAPRTALPPDLSLDGWQVAVRAGDGYRTLPRAETVRTLGQLYEALPAKAR